MVLIVYLWKTINTMQAQATSSILMIRPVRFGFNAQTAASNAFQDATATKQGDAQTEALYEFDTMVQRLRAAGVEVTVVDDSSEPHTPDSIFPNNWVSFHHSGKIILYPMQAKNRRLERRMDIIEDLQKTFHVEEIIDLTHFENQEQYLEGTGSLVLDRENRIAYACLSSRTQPPVLAAWKNLMSGYEVVDFEAVDGSGLAIYHTNVVMCVGDTFAVICLEAIPDFDQRLYVKNKLQETGKEIIEISFEQLNHFAGNMLLVKKVSGAKLLVMSTQAHQSLTDQQRRTLGTYAEILHVDLHVIEANGGGSARCMMAEIHLPKK